MVKSSAQVKTKKPVKQVKELTQEQKEAAEKHKEQKKMLGYLKYMQVKSDATPEQREDAATGLRIYHGLKADKKGPFLERWKATKDNKSTQWMKTFEEELQKDKTVERNTLRGLYTRQVPPMHLCNCVLVCSHL